jgi:hypothetical protein
MATLEELEARVSELETKFSKFKSCTCDPTRYASSEDMNSAQRTINALETALGNVSNKIGTLPDGQTVVGYIDEKAISGGGVSTEEFNGLVMRVGTIPAGKTLVGYVDEQTSITTQQMQTEPMFEFTVPAGSASITVETPSDFWNAVSRGLMVAVNGGQALETTWHIGGDSKNVRSDYVYIYMVGTWSIEVTAYASEDQDISVDRHIALYGMTTVSESVKTKVSALETVVAGIRSCTCDPTKYASQAEFDNAKRAIGALEAAAGNLVKLIGTLPEGTAATTIVGYVDEKTNVPTCQLPLTAAELTEKLNKV